MDKNIAIEFQGVGKQYRLGRVGTGTLQHDLNRFWQTRIMGREDPYLKIGEVNDRSQKAHSDYVWALKDINFKVEQGDVVGIIGKNGAGKSTLLKLLSHITAPSTGDIFYRGRIASLLEVGTGFHGELTGKENIYMNGAVLGMTKHEIKRKLDDIVEFAGVEKYIDTPVKRYSSGMTVRLGFAVAAFLEPEILVVDEVLTVGDAEFQKRAIGKMDDVAKNGGRTVLFVSHNMASVRSLCNSGILLKDGTLNFTGNVDDVVDKYMQECVPPVMHCPVSEMPREGELTYLLKFTGIEFLDKGNISTTPHCGNFIKIRIYFDVNIDIARNCIISLGVNDNFDTRILSFNSLMTNNVFTFDRGKHYVDCNIPKLPLTGGSYKIGLWASVDRITADYVYYAIPLNVINDDFFNTGREIAAHLSGRVALCDHNWNSDK